METGIQQELLDSVGPIPESENIQNVNGGRGSDSTEFSESETDTDEWVLLEKGDDIETLDDTLETSTKGSKPEASALESSVTTRHQDSAKVTKNDIPGTLETPQIKIQPNVKLDLPNFLEFSQPMSRADSPLADPLPEKGSKCEVEGDIAAPLAPAPQLLEKIAVSIGNAFHQIYQGIHRWVSGIPSTLHHANEHHQTGKDSKKSKESKGSRPTITVNNNSTTKRIPSDSSISSCHKNYGIVKIGSGSTIQLISDNYGVISIGENSRVNKIDCNYGIITTGGDCVLDYVYCNYGTIVTRNDDHVTLGWNYGCIRQGPGTTITIKQEQIGVITTDKHKMTSFTTSDFMGKQDKPKEYTNFRFENGNWKPFDSAHNENFNFGKFVVLQGHPWGEEHP